MAWSGKEWIRNTFREVFTPERGQRMAALVLCLLALVMLDISGAIDPAKNFLKSPAATFTFGDKGFTAYHIIHSMILIILLIWVAGVALRLIERRIRLIRGMRASNRTLIVKAIYTLAYFLIFLQALNIIGINMTALAVFSGAVGIGVGFGLQKITSNFISGIILLFEKSVEENDLVELEDGTMGFVRMTSGRYTLVETADGKEVMIPNEDFITKRVTNCTHSNTFGRVEIRVGVAYDCDIEKARDLMLEAAKEHPLCSKRKDKSPMCILDQFAESSVNFILYFWVENVREGRLEPKSDVMRAIWKKFKDNKIEIPYPQREVRMKGMQALKVKGQKE